MHRLRAVKARCGKTIVLRINAIHAATEDDDDVSDRVDLSQKPSTSSMSEYISSRKSSSLATAALNDQSKASINVQNVEDLSRPNYFSTDASQSTTSDGESAVFELSRDKQNDEDLAIRGGLSGSYMSEDPTSDPQSSRLLERERRSARDSSARVRTLMGGGRREVVSRSNSLEPSKLSCPPSWMSPSDIGSDWLDNVYGAFYTF